MKKKLLIALVMVMVLTFTGCGKDNSQALKFKEDYESLNGEVNSSGKEHRSVSVSSDNPFVFTDAKDIVKRIENKETFYVYFGSKLCPWCRSVIEKAIEVADANDIDKIYYVDIWDDEGNEILRDSYELKDDEPSEVSKGTKAYYKLLEYFDSVLSEYTLTSEGGDKVNVGEKRIYAPNYFYVKDGKVVKMTSGISAKQKDSREKLTKEILNDEEVQFEKFFNN